MFEGFRHGRIRIEDIEISYVVGGEGPPVLMLHGFPQCKAMWAHVAPALARHYTVVCADLRGYGDSDKPVGQADSANYSFRAMAADQLGLMQHLGYREFHLVGHDRGGRTGHRLALDNPEALLSLTLMDIVPTHVMLTQTNRQVAGAYWHWYFLSQPAPFPETLIAPDPDYFYETSLVGWGATRLADFDPQLLAQYRGAWRDPAMIHGSCCDYRAAVGIDLALDTADLERRVACPTLVFYGAAGQMAQLYDIPAHWRARCADVRVATLPGGHFFVDQFPVETAQVLTRFLSGQAP